MLTVAEALQLESFRAARVVAGERGLTNPVGWVHNVGVPDAAQWLNGGELVLTTPFNLPDGDEAQVRYLHALIDKGIAALAIAIGNRIECIPDFLKAVADKRDFPLIEVPFEARFVDIARSVNERIAQSNLETVTRALDIHKTLTRLVLEGGGIKELATTLAELLNQSVSIETDRFDALAAANIGAVDEARRYTQQYGRTDPRLVAALEDDILPRIRATLHPVFIPAMPQVGLEMERILAPIVVHGEIFGFVWIIADTGRALNDLDTVAIESAATIAALMMLHQDSIQNAEASLKGNLLARLIQGEMSGANVLTDTALRYNVDLRQPFRVVLVEYPQATSNRLIKLYRDVNHQFKINTRAAIVGQYAGQIVILMQATEDTGIIIEDFRSVTSREGKARIGVSTIHEGARLVRQAYKECREVLQITRQLGQHGPDLYFDQLGFLHALFHAGPAAMEGSPYIPALRDLLNEHHADLFHTLETYLDAGGNGVATAEALHIHRSTLNYRLARITEVCHADLSDPATRVNLHVALKLLRLFGMN